MKKILSTIIALVMIVMCIVPVDVFASEKQTTVNRYNVVFVIDASTSMKYSDKNDNRFEATDLFLGMLANSGNYVGTVIFNGNIKATDIKDIDGNSAKKEISKAIRNNKLAADTDIGGALLKATDMLKNNGNKNLPSIIILLSDGNTDFDEKKQIDKSKQNKETALENARDNGYSIYTVSLNSNGKADAKELKAISKATKGGLFEEVNDAKDLKDVFDNTTVVGVPANK
ncbi:MAG: VWA domain-containing protein, partial [Erysipelotrichia bacterium]|nr:VWA domain-containing protein [Erysipelotrichia bacterium]